MIEEHSRPVGRPRKAAVPDEQYDEAARMYSDGVPLKKVAAYYQVSVYEIRRVLLMTNTPLRERGRPRNYEGI